MAADSDIAVAIKDFVQEDKRDEVIRKLEASSSRVVIIKGASGAGKSQVALQIEKTWKRRHSDLVFGKFACRTEEELKLCIRNFSVKYKLDLSEDTEIGSILENLCNQMKKKCESRKKLLIIDDAEISNILLLIDQNICSLIEDQKSEWAVVVTTQSLPDKRFDGCDFIDAATDVVELIGLSDDVVDRFFGNKPKTRQLTTQDKEKIKETFGTLPVFLQVLRAEIENDKTANSVSEALSIYLEQINSAGITHHGVSLLRASFDRILLKEAATGRSEQFKHMLMLLTTIGDNDITRELLIELAEVVLASTGPRQDIYTEAYNLQRDLVKEMCDRSLCDEPSTFAKTKLLSIHHCVKLAMRTYREPQDYGRDAHLLWDSLVALTRVTPKDGRSLGLEDINLFLYEHARALLQQIEAFRTRVSASELLSPMRLLVASLHVALAYCQRRLRATWEDTEKYILNALDEISLLLANQSYEEVIGTDQSSDKLKAQELYQLFTASNFPLLSNQYYQEFVDSVPQHRVVTRSDLERMFNNYTPGDNLSQWLCNGSRDVSAGPLLPERFLFVAKKVVDPAKMREIYCVEQLAEIYMVAARGKNFHGDVEHREKCISYGEAALYLYERIRVDKGVPLLAEVIMKRDLLKVKLAAEDLGNDDLEQIMSEWNDLSTAPTPPTTYVYEYGIWKTDLTSDPFHIFCCDKGIACTEGKMLARRCADSLLDPPGLTSVVEKFKKLIQSQTKQATVKHRTLSKLRMNYAEFLWSCGHVEPSTPPWMSPAEKELRSGLVRDAVGVAIDACKDLHLFLLDVEGSTDASSFPEQRKSCGRIVPYLKLLEKCHASYQLNRSDGGLLPNTGGEDCERRSYLRQFCAAVMGQCDDPDRFEVMRHISEAAGIGESDGTDRVMGSVQPQS